MLAYFPALWLTAAAFAVEPVLLDRPAPKLVTGNLYRDALQRDITATWENVEFRALLRRLEADRGVAVLLDRRVDPNAIYEIRFHGEPLRDAFARLAQRADAVVSFPEHVVYVGPGESAWWLLTAIEQGELALTDAALHIPERRQLELAARKTVRWQDLATPRDILSQIGTQHQLAFDGLDAVPHDLWAATTLPQVTASSALTLVLIQLDLRWEWQPGGQGVRLLPWEPPALIERRYQPRGKNLAEAAKLWTDELVEATVRIAGNELVVSGRSEDHRLAQILRATGSLPKRTTPAANTVPLRRRQFTLRVERVSVRAIMKELEKSGATFEYDDAALKQAGVSLDQPISLDVQKVDADTFLKAVFDPVGVTFEVDGLVVKLK
jgi:hypothetical protein